MCGPLHFLKLASDSSCLQDRDSSLVLICDCWTSPEIPNQTDLPRLAAGAPVDQKMPKGSKVCSNQQAAGAPAKPSIHLEAEMPRSFSFAVSTNIQWACPVPLLSVTKAPGITAITQRHNPVVSSGCGV